MGQLFIFENGFDTNNPSSTKQNLDGTTDLVVLASAADSNRYYHNWINLASPSGPEIDVTPTSHDYGGVVVGANAFRTFAIRNLGGTNLQFNGATLVGGQASDFAITQGAAPVTVTPGATHNVEVRFTPAALGLRTTTLRLASNDANENPVDVPLSGTGSVAAPDIAVTPTSYGYGTQPVGVGITQNFTVSNTGTMSLSVGAPTLLGPDAAAFAITSGQAGFSVAPSGNDTIQVRFTAPTAGPKNATLRIPSNDPNENPVDVALTGTGSVGGTTPTFEELQHGGSTSSTSVTTATNLTGVTGHLYLAAISSTSYRTVSAVTGLGVTWTRVAAQCGGRSRTGIELWWAQGAATTGSVTATLESASDAAEIAVARYSGVAATNPVSPLVAGNTNGVNGSCSGGSDQAAYSLGVTTTASQAVALGVVAIRYRTHTPGSGYTERAEVAIGSGGSVAGIALVDRSVPVASSLLLNGSFDGDVDWAVIGVELRPGAGGPADIDVTPTSHNYGGVTLGANAVRTFAIRNLGGTTLQVTGTNLTGSQAAEFAITLGGAPFNVAPGATHNLDVRFTPAAQGVRSATLQLMSNDADEATVNVLLSGTGIAAAPEVVVTPASYGYGNQPVGVGVTQTFTISNTGTSDLVVGASSLSGPDAAAFAITSGQTGFTIAPGNNNTIQVRFTPPTTGPKSATLSIPTNDGDENPVLVALSGTGSTGEHGADLRGSATRRLDGSGDGVDRDDRDGRDRPPLSRRRLEQAVPGGDDGDGPGPDLDASRHAVRRPPSNRDRPLVGDGISLDRNGDRDLGDCAQHGLDRRVTVFRRCLDEPRGVGCGRQFEWGEWCVRQRNGQRRVLIQRDDNPGQLDDRGRCRHPHQDAHARVGLHGARGAPAGDRFRHRHDRPDGPDGSDGHIAAGERNAERRRGLGSHRRTASGCTMSSRGALPTEKEQSE